MMMNKNQKITINLPQLYPAQLAVAKACLQKKNKYIVVNGSRQVGKSAWLSTMAIYFALEKANRSIMVVSPTDSMVRKLQKDIINILGPSIKITVKSHKAQSGDAEIIFNNKTVILFRSAASEDSLRGYSLTHLLLDECAFIKEETWTTILAPTLTVRGEKVLFCSTPRGANFFKKLYNYGLAKEPGYVSFKLNWRSNPYADIEFIKEQERILPPEIYAQEYEGVFTDSASVFKNIKELAILPQSKQKQPCVIGIDIAFKKDYTVAVALSQEGKMLDYIRFNKLETNDLVNKLYEFYLKWEPSKTIIEENNQGLPIYHLLREKGIYNFESFNTNSKSKGDLINPLMAAFSKKEILLLNDPVVIGEFEAFTYTITKNGNVTFSAAYGNDDIVMAFAFAYYAKSKSTYVPLAWA